MNLSDGVFAIALTLLTLDISAPAGWNGQLATLWPKLAPELGTYVMTALVISIFWLLHRRFVAMILRLDSVAMALNLVLLSLIALLPPATRFAEASGGNPSVLGLYATLVVAIGVCTALFWGYAALIRGLVFPHLPPRVRWVGFLTPLVAPPAFLFATIGTGMPQAAVPFVLFALFVGMELAFSRAMRVTASSVAP
jgi:uncharacterized membrane protein